MQLEVIEVISTRRTVFEFQDKAVESDKLEAALSAGLLAQNHHLTQPWRFVALGPETHKTVAEMYADDKLKAVAPEIQSTARAKAVQKLLSKPAIVVVSYVLQENDVARREDFAATCCAIQNIQLAAWDHGLGMQWSTNSLIRSPEVYRLLNIDPKREEMIAMLYFGYPASIPRPRSRQGLHEVLRQTP